MQAFLKKFWKEQSIDMEQLEITSEQSFKTHNDLPLARIKRIMKSDEDVRMISARARVKSTRCPFAAHSSAQAEAPVLFAKACELFILELTLRSWCYSEQSKRVHPARKTLQKEDISAAIHKTENFDFLVDSVGRSAPPPPPQP
ncbi:nuclear transcription factor Y subunit gamma [Aureococcus anophagefferens]|uniref:Nuclear transcription factor Y subunit gamma n=1 Tax=Aureococcus anophagefferens TaxID=44056 RepID=A0ABR1G7L8_AURAN